MVRTEHDLRRSFAQGWIERRAGQLLAHVPGKGIEKHALGGRQLAISGAATPEPRGWSNRLPVRGTVDRALEPGWVDKGLQQQQRMAETGRPVTHDPTRAQTEKP